jgi:DNA polymerase III alpha subunit
MQFAPFTHLHAHSDFSLLSGAMSVSTMLDKAAELCQTAVELYSEAMRRGTPEL